MQLWKLECEWVPPRRLCSSHCALSSLVNSFARYLLRSAVGTLLHWKTVNKHEDDSSCQDIRIAFLHSEYLSAQVLRSILASQDASSPPILNRNCDNQVLQWIRGLSQADSQFHVHTSSKRARFLAFKKLFHSIISHQLPWSHAPRAPKSQASCSCPFGAKGVRSISSFLWKSRDTWFGTYPYNGTHPHQDLAWFIKLPAWLTISWASSLPMIPLTLFVTLWTWS